MSDVYPHRKLCDVCEIKPPKKETKEKLEAHELVSFVPMDQLGICQKNIGLTTSRPLSEVYSGYTYFGENDVLLAKITPCFENGKLGIARNLTNGVGFGSSEYIVFRCSSTLDPEYLFLFLSQESYREDGAQNMAGAVGHKRVTKEFIDNSEIPIPPLPEQRRIVAILDEAFEGIDVAIANTQNNLVNARELFESILDQTFNRKDTSRTNTTLGKSCEFFNGKAHEKSIDENGKYIVVNSKFISTEGGVIKRTNTQMFPLVTNDITMVMSDVPKGKALAKCYVIEEDGKYSLNQRICCIKSDNFLIEYLYFQLNRHPYFLSFDNKGSQANLRKDNILSCPLYMPDFKEQKSILNMLVSAKEKARALEATYQQKLDSLNELKQSLLAKAFSGELTAQPDQVLKEAVG